MKFSLPLPTIRGCAKRPTAAVIKKQGTATGKVEGLYANNLFSPASISTPGSPCRLHLGELYPVCFYCQSGLQFSIGLQQVVGCRDYAVFELR